MPDVALAAALLAVAAPMHWQWDAQLRSLFRPILRFVRQHLVRRAHKKLIRQHKPCKHYLAAPQRAVPQKPVLSAKLALRGHNLASGLTLVIPARMSSIRVP